MFFHQAGSMLRLCCIRVMVPVLLLAGMQHAWAGPDALWHIVHEQCRPHGPDHSVSPCVTVNHRYAVLKDRVGASQYLLIPTRRLTGMEDPLITRADAPDYFAYAWRQADRVSQHLGRTLPPDDLSLAINSAYGRSQNQLHIHVDCIRPDVKVALHWARSRLGPAWTPLPLAGHAYRARLVGTGNLAGIRPFRLLMRDMADPVHEMGRHTLVVSAITRPDGQVEFVLLDDRTDPTRADPASGEELQDHSCGIARFP
ncbi:CDP-diacylglycerol pyrophosphatase [Komagataeibacter melomenusus]